MTARRSARDIGRLIQQSILLSVATSATLSNYASAAELRATFLQQCPTTDYPKAGTQPEALETLALGIASAFVGNLVDAGLATLKKTLVPDAKSIQAYFRQDGLYAFKKDIPPTTPPTPDRVIPNPNLACLVVAVGDFGALSGTWQLPFAADDKRKDTAVTTLMNTLGLKAAPTMYLEAVRVLSPDRTALTWQPTQVYIGDYLSTNFFAGPSRGLSFEIYLYKPGQDKEFTSETLSFDDVTKPFSKGSADLVQGNRGQWLAVPAASNPSNIVGLKADADGAPFDPFTLNVRIVESPKPYQLAQMFSDAVASKSSDIKQAVQQAVVPAPKQPAATLNQSAITALQTYESDLAAAQTACASATVGPNAVASASAQLACDIAKSKAKLSHDAATSACASTATGGVAACAKIPPSP